MLPSVHLRVTQQAPSARSWVTAALGTWSHLRWAISARRSSGGPRYAFSSSVSPNSGISSTPCGVSTISPAEKTHSGVSARLFAGSRVCVPDAHSSIQRGPAGLSVKMDTAKSPDPASSSNWASRSRALPARGSSTWLQPLAPTGARQRIHDSLHHGQVRRLLPCLLMRCLTAVRRRTRGRRLRLRNGVRRHPRRQPARRRAMLLGALLAVWGAGCLEEHTCTSAPGLLGNLQVHPRVYVPTSALQSWYKSARMQARARTSLHLA